MIDWRLVDRHREKYGPTQPVGKLTRREPPCIHRGRLFSTIPRNWISCGCGEVRVYECRHFGDRTIEQPVMADAWKFLHSQVNEVARVCAGCPQRDTQTRTGRRRPKAPREITKAVFAFPTLHWAGVEQWLLSLLTALQGDRTTLRASVALTGDCDPEILRRVRELADVRQGDACGELIRDADVCVVWSLDSLPRWLADWDGPVWGASHGAGGDWWMAKNAHWVDRWVAVSKAATGPCPGPATVIHNGCDETRLRPTMMAMEARQSLGLQPNDIGVGILARLSAEKRHEEAIRRWHLLPERYRLVIVGSGAREAELRAMARPLGSRVVFAGLRRDIGNVYSGLDATMLLSAHEGFALSIVESLLREVPTIATPVGAVPELPSILGGPQPCHVVNDLDSLPAIVMHAIGRHYKRGPADNLQYLTAEAMARRWAAALDRA